jgi:L-rhamnonate dehydratase
MTSRRNFLTTATTLGTTAAFASVPIKTNQIINAFLGTDSIIDAVDILKISGPFTSIPGVNKQYQVQPIHIYPALRPGPYSDKTDAKETTSTIIHYFIQIKTKGGLSGLYGPIEPECNAPIINQLKPFLMGKDAMAIEALWDQMYRMNRHSRAGHYMMAMSAVDNALWDLKGKFFKAPVYELLGGATRSEVQVYGSCLSFTVEKGKAGARAKALLDKGFLHQKWFMAYGPGSGQKGLNQSIALMEELRSTLGWDAQIMIDSFMGWDFPFANSWSKEAEKFRPYWLEEPFPVDRLESFTQLRQNTTIPLATGEHFYSRWEAFNFLKAGAIDIVQADPEWCGGVSELVKICHLASSFGAKVVPHGHNIHAALHVIASQSPDVCPIGEYLVNHMPHKLNFQKNPLLCTNGIIPLPSAPGFGIEWNERVEKNEILKL